MTENCDIGELGLECLMSRANIIFTSGYKFYGQLDIDNLQQSFINVVDGIHKFKHRLDYTSQSNYQWQQLTGPFKNRFLVVESDDINQEFKNVCGRSFDILANSGHYPMALVLILENNNQQTKPDSEKNFIIAQLSEHTYVDAGSSEVIFNNIIDHYNALTNHDIEKTQSILKVTNKLKTIGTQAMVDLLKQEHFDHQQNIEKLTTYPVADVGEHKVPLDSIPGHLEKFKTRVRKPIIQFFDIKNLVKQCREIYPEISRNSATCAAICKAIYNLNVAIKGAGNEHIISFKMLSNILPENMRGV